MIYDLGERLKDLRIKNGLSQKAVGERLGLTTSAISTYEHNTNQPPIDVLIKLAALYGTTSDYILGLKPQKVISLDGLDKDQQSILEEINRLIIKLLQGYRQ